MFSAFFYLRIIVKVGVLVGRDFYLRENIWNGNLVWRCFMQISLDRRRRRGEGFCGRILFNNPTFRGYLGFSLPLFIESGQRLSSWRNPATR